MVRALFLSALVLLAPKARAEDERQVINLQSAILRTPEGTVLEVKGGAYLNDEALLHTSKELVALKAENKELRESPPTAAKTVIVALVLGLVVGAGSTAYLLFRR